MTGSSSKHGLTRQYLVSIVIPTCGRPQFLRRALDSAVHMEPDTEIVVVPNGRDRSWVRALDAHRADNRVRVAPIDVAHGCAARNHGLALARGKYVRFLDDDDLLYPVGALQQLALIERTGADVVSAPIHLLTGNEVPFRTLTPPETSDFVSAALRSDRLLQVTSHLFRRDWIRNVAWDESLPFAQDVDWIFKLCRVRDPLWEKSDIVAGGWRRHTGHRTTIGAGLHRSKQMIAEAIIDLVAFLSTTHRLDDQRRAAAASGLWECVHSALFTSPQYWSKIAAQAEALHPGSAPDTAFFRSRLVRMSRLSPLRWEQILASKRLLSYGIRRTALSLGLARTW